MDRVPRLLVASLLLLFPMSVFPPSLLARPHSQPQTPELDPEVQRRVKIAELMQQVFATDDLREKEKLYKQILEIDPYHASAVQGLIDAQARIKEEEKVRTQSQETRLKKQEAIENARQAYLAHDLGKADEWVTSALAIDPDDPEALALQQHIASDLRSRQLKVTAVWVLAAALGIGLAAFLVLRLRRTGGILEVLEGDESGRLIPLNDEATVLGSLESEADHVIFCPSRRISRRHCSLLKSGKHYFLSDHSTNGTFVNGRPVTKGQPVLLHAGDQISLAGDITLRFRYK
jgi:hypothetical protein